MGIPAAAGRPPSFVAGMKSYSWDSASARELSTSRTRIMIALAVLAVLVAVLMLRMFFLQVVQHEHYTTLSRDNRMRIVPILPQRGEIYSSDGVLMAGNLPTYNLAVLPEYRSRWPSPAVVHEMAQLLDANAEIILRRFAESQPGQDRPTVLLDDLSEEKVAVFEVNRHRFPGVGITTGFRRYYPLAEVSAHIIGRIGGIDERTLSVVDDPRLYRIQDRIGKSGIERRYERQLRGQLGYYRAEVNAEGRIVRILETMPPRQGERLVLNIDADLQLEAHAALDDRRGAVIALEPASGRILAMVSSPTYDPNLFTIGLDARQYRHISLQPGAPLYNRGIRGQYPPGSVLKPFLAYAALQQDLRAPLDGLRCPGFYQLHPAGRRFRDWRPYGHGEVDMASALEQSCDVYFYRLARDMGIKRLADALQNFGFGRATGIDLDGEKSGLVPSRQWKQQTHGEPWHPGETVIAGIGQGYILVTPLQMAVATAALATDGRLPVPMLLDERYDPLTNELIDAPSALVHTTLAGANEHWQLVRAGMRRVVHGELGTARGIALGLRGYEIAGKTGTAQVVVRELSGTAEAFEDHSLFIAYAPVAEPRIALAVIIEHSGGGSVHAAPLARRLLDHYLGDGRAIANAAP